MLFDALETDEVSRRAFLRNEALLDLVERCPFLLFRWGEEVLSEEEAVDQGMSADFRFKGLNVSL